MIRRLIPTLLLFCLSTFLSAQSNKPLVEFYTPTISGNPGDTVCLPIKVRNFRQVLGVGLGLRWNSEALQFLEVRTEGYAISDNRQSNFGLTNVENGDLKWTWLSSDFPMTVTVPDESTLFELCFVLSSDSTGNFYSLSFDSGFIAPEVILDDNLYANPIATTNYIPGGVFIRGENNIELLPDFQFQLLCGAYDATINTAIQGGQAPYRYIWEGPMSYFSNASSIEATRAGLYHLTVVDQNGDSVRAEIRVDFMRNQDGLEEPEANSTVINPECGLANGNIDIMINDPMAYDYFWNTGDTTEDLTNLSAGNYHLLIRSKENNCTDSLNFTLVSQGEITLDVIQDSIECRGDTATIGVINSEGLFTYQWNTGDTSKLLSVTTAGDYSITVSDGSCSRVENFTLVDNSNPPNPNNFIIVEENLACDDTTATIGVTYFGLRPDLSYSWSTGDTTDKIQVTAVGLYTLDVAGEDGCSITFTYEVIQEDPILPLEKEINFQGCLSATTKLAMVPQDGRLYDFIWNTAETTSSIIIDSAGTYTVTVTETLTTCGQTFVFDAEEIGDPSQGAVNLSIDCGIEGNCYQGTTLYIQVEGAAEPVQYSWSDGTSILGQSTDSLEIYSLLPQDLFIQDADGCTDTIQNLLSDCQLELITLDLKAHQYLVCETDPQTSQTTTYVYTEVLNSNGVAPYIFYWGNGVVDTSYFRSRQPLDSLPNLFISITDRIGNRFDKQTIEVPASYDCNNASVPLLSASDTIVEAGASFNYPIFIENQQGLELFNYSIDWDPCLVTIDSVSFYHPDGSIQVNNQIGIGTFTAIFLDNGGSISGGRDLLVELHGRAKSQANGISPLLVSIDGTALLSDSTEVLIRPQHGSITVAQESDLIFPGDANLSGRANHKDLLNLGLVFQTRGPDRREQQISSPEYGFSWLDRTPQSMVDLKHIDCNGDGQIDNQDLAAINQNFSYVPSPEREPAENTEVALVFAADTLFIGQKATFPVLLGSEAAPANSVYGLAFSLRYDPAVIDESSISVDFGESWLLNGTSPLSYFRVDTENELIHLALSRTDKQDISGFGAVAEISFDVISEDTTNTSFQTLDATLIMANEVQVPVLTAMNEVVVQITTQVQEIAQRSLQVRVFPNPVKDKIYLEAVNLELQAYRLYDGQGRLIKSGPITLPILKLGDLPRGIYWLQLQTDQGMVRKRLIR